MPVVATFWQVVGWIAGFVIVAGAIGGVAWIQRRRRASRARRLAQPPPAPRKPNGEDRR